MGWYRIVTTLLATAIFSFFGRGASQPPPTTVPCSREGQRTWVVEDSTQAEALAAATNCSGGYFEVEWRGSVVVNRTIYIADGTMMNVTGADPSAVMNGNGSSQLFYVTNASLYLDSVGIIFGSSRNGGAIAAVGSSLILTQTSFSGNHADFNGGAVYVSDGSNVSCVDVNFVDNSACGHGGAMYVSDRSAISYSGECTCHHNVAGGKGVRSGCSMAPVCPGSTRWCSSTTRRSTVVP